MNIRLPFLVDYSGAAVSRYSRKLNSSNYGKLKCFAHRGPSLTRTTCQATASWTDTERKKYLVESFGTTNLFVYRK